MGKKLLQAVSLSALMIIATDAVYAKNERQVEFCLLCPAFECPKDKPIEVLVTSKNPKSSLKAKVSTQQNPPACFGPSATIALQTLPNYAVTTYSVSIKYPSGKVFVCNDIKVRTGSPTPTQITYHKNNTCSAADWNIH